MRPHSRGSLAHPSYSRNSVAWVREHDDCRSRHDAPSAGPDAASGLAGLDYPAIGPEHAWLADQRRADYAAVSDEAALDAAKTLARAEGILPALESAHAVAGFLEQAPRMKKDGLVIINISGRGDKDMDTYSRLL